MATVLGCVRYWSNLVQLQADCVVKDPSIHVCPLIEEKKVISQLRLGYTLNEYRYKIGLQESPLCSCGAIETVDHYICECEVYELDRQKLLTRLFYQTGEQGISTEIFLSLKDEVFKEHRIGLLMMLSDYITSTKRFIRK